MKNADIKKKTPIKRPKRRLYGFVTVAISSSKLSSFFSLFDSVTIQVHPIAIKVSPCKSYHQSNLSPKNLEAMKALAMMPIEAFTDRRVKSAKFTAHPWIKAAVISRMRAIMPFLVPKTDYLSPTFF